VYFVNRIPSSDSIFSALSEHGPGVMARFSGVWIWVIVRSESQAESNYAEASRFQKKLSRTLKSTVLVTLTTLEHAQRYFAKHFENVTRSEISEEEVPFFWDWGGRFRIGRSCVTKFIMPS
jgi:hypothetical protein